MTTQQATQQLERLKTVKGVSRARPSPTLMENLSAAWTGTESPEADARRKEAQRRLELLKGEK